MSHATSDAVSHAASDELDAIVVGAGPNGLAAAVTLARAGLSVRLYERSSQVGGGTRTVESTLPSFLHDQCSAVHPLALASPFFREFELARRVELITPEVSFGHPLEGRSAGLAYRDLDLTVERLGRDGPSYRSLVEPLVERWQQLTELSGSSLLPFPRHLGTAIRLGMRMLDQGTPLWNTRFRDEVAPAMVTGVAAHSILRVPSLAMAAAGLTLLAHAHAGGWPVPRGGSQAIADALADDFRSHGGEIVLDTEVTDLRDLPSSRALILDITPRKFVHLTGNALPPLYRRSLERFRYGNGVAKVDFALSGPVPWKDPSLADALTLHVGGTRAEIARAENTVSRGRHASRPYVLAAQPSIVDDTRAPGDGQTLWTYTHVPAGSPVDQREVITQRIEQFAPGFRDRIVGVHSTTAAELPDQNPNYVNGDISAGLPSLLQLVRRPVLSPHPWDTPLDGVYLCGASTVPGPGVHGLSGWYAAQRALSRDFRLPAPDLGL